MHYAFLAVLCAVTLIPRDTCFAMTPKFTGDLFEHAQSRRTAVTDLEISGDLRGLPPASTRYLARQELLLLPQVSYTVNDDSNFTEPTQISGVLLEDLLPALAGDPDRM